MFPHSCLQFLLQDLPSCACWYLLEKRHPSVWPWWSVLRPRAGTSAEPTPRWRCQRWLTWRRMERTALVLAATHLKHTNTHTLINNMGSLWIGLHVHLSTWLAACGDADKSRPPSLVSSSPAYTLPLSLLSPITNTHTQTDSNKPSLRMRAGEG